ncbi:MAG: hypothetical protein ABSA26_12395 [Thermoguttaceae bacterium]|jgi:hypothetical protein
MVYRGHIQNGLVVIDDQVSLPDGMAVLVEPLTPEKGKSLAERFQDVIACVSDLPADMAENHDRYIHGTTMQ